MSRSSASTPKVLSSPTPTTYTSTPPWGRSGRRRGCPGMPWSWCSCPTPGATTSPRPSTTTGCSPTRTPLRKISKDPTAFSRRDREVLRERVLHTRHTRRAGPRPRDGGHDSPHLPDLHLHAGGARPAQGLRVQQDG